MKSMPNTQELLDQVNNYSWYHHVPLGPGVVTPGSATVTWQKHELPSFKDQTVLDIGAWDGGYSFLAERGEPAVWWLSTTTCGASTG